MKIEKRYKNYEIKEKNNTVEGYVLKWNTEADLGGGMTERFIPDSIMVDDSAEMLFNHDSNSLLGRNKANLHFENREDGLYYRLDLMNTFLSSDIKEMIRQKVITGASLGFIPEKESMKGNCRVIEKANLQELSLVTTPAYDSSSAMLRSLKKKCHNYHWGNLILDV